MKKLSFCFVLIALTCGAAEPADPNWQSCCGTGQTLTDAVSPLETVSATPGARVLLSKQVGKWDAGNTHAIITALDVEIPAGQRARGLKIDLSRPGATETVYAEESVFPLLQQTLQIYSAHLPAAAGRAGNPRALFWAQFFDYKGGTVHPLAVAVYFDAASNGPGITIGKSPKSNGSKGMFDFPKYLPKDFAEVVAAGIAALNETRSLGIEPVSLKQDETLPPAPSTATQVAGASSPETGFIPLFDGKTFDGWKMAAENQESWKIEDGAIVTRGPRSHLYYIGDAKPFKNFDLKVDVMTEAGANGGIYFHTKYKDTGFPWGGFECQVNNTNGDWKKTGSIYDVANLTQSAAQDGKWWTQEIVVQGSHVSVLIDGKRVLEYVEPPGVTAGATFERKLGDGTFALQAHDPMSVVRYRNIRVKRLN